MNRTLKHCLPVAVLSLAGCQTFDVEKSIGVDPTDNAVICAAVDLDPAWSESRASYRRIELPKDYTVTPEQLAALLSSCPG